MSCTWSKTHTSRDSEDKLSPDKTLLHEGHRMTNLDDANLCVALQVEDASKAQIVEARLGH